MKRLPFTRDGFTLFVDTNTGRVTWEKTDTRPDSPHADLLRPENPSRAVLEDDYARDPHKACQRALRLTRDVSENNRVEAINTLLGMHGTEAIRGEWQNGYWGDIVATYCNAGDTYDTTVLHVRGDTSFHSGRFIISSWGDFVERYGKKYGIE
jgi:hypothetical protein